MYVTSRLKAQRGKAIFASHVGTKSKESIGLTTRAVSKLGEVADIKSKGKTLSGLSKKRNEAEIIGLHSDTTRSWLMEDIDVSAAERRNQCFSP